MLLLFVLLLLPKQKRKVTAEEASHNIIQLVEYVELSITQPFIFLFISDIQVLEQR